MSLTLKLTHSQDSVHVKVPNLRPETIYARFLKEFPECVDPSPTLRWRDNDGDWINIRQDDTDLEPILMQALEKKGYVHIQSADTAGVYEPTELETLMHRYERVMDNFSLLTRSIVKLPPISNVLLVTKPDPKLAKLTKELSVWLLEHFPQVSVFVDEKLKDRSSFKYRHIIKQNPSWEDRIHFWEMGHYDGSREQIHLVVALGGDGTVLYTTWMFQRRVPPIVAFHLGSLGFLTNFHFETYRATMTNIIRGDGVNLNLRMRLQCSVYKCHGLTKKPDLRTNGISSSVTIKSDGDSSNDDSDDTDVEVVELAEYHRKEIMHKVKAMDSKRGAEVADLDVCHDNAHRLVTRIPNPTIEEFTTPTDSWQVLNEVTVDRGSNAGMLLLELYVDGEPVTTILADGLVIATATGSTAYSLSIGGSLIHPDKNSIIISPIAPHSLTARPMIIPGTRHLRVCVPETSRTTAWASFDGRHRQELGRGDSVMITGSKYPAATICRRDQSTDWFLGLTQLLNWNSRVQQKPFEPHL